MDNWMLVICGVVLYWGCTEAWKEIKKIWRGERVMPKNKGERW